jgi:hypothetical protein
VSEEVTILKGEEQEHPVPSAWRVKLQEIIGAFADGNFSLAAIENVDPLDAADAAGIARNIADYGCTLRQLPDASWDTSVCQWQLNCWEVLADLFTIEEGRSDLVLQVFVFEEEGRTTFKVHLVYVP